MVTAIDADSRMAGTLVLQAGGPFSENDELDRTLLQAVSAKRVVVLPTADAFEHPERLIAAAMAWGERLGVEVEAVMVLQRSDAMNQGMADIVAQAHAVYLVGDQPLHLRSVLKDSPTWAALVSMLDNGGLVVAVGGAVSALCDPMVDPRGGAFTLGLGLVRGAAVMTESDQWSHERLARTLDLADKTVVELPSGSAIIRRRGQWEMVGEAV
ncbi:MAG TPA: hypothetical protein PKV27_09490, partial [Ilumatobacteraceae bacterium]|nr:hypothetical protein [Ilumatobacteraceae bacterium]